MSSGLFVHDAVPLTAQLDAIKDAKAHFLATGEMLPVVRREIADSWKRCLHDGVQRETPGYLTLSKEEFEKLKDINQILIQAAASVTEVLCKTLKQINFVMYLTDKNCNILYMNEEYYFEEGFEGFILKEGRCWDERYAGTNSASLCLKENSHIIIFGPEHFCRSTEKVVCSSSPVHSPSGELLGTISITYYMEFYNRLISGITATAAELIEKQLLNLRYRNIIQYTLSNMDEGILILDSKLQVLKANATFLKILNIEPEQIHSVDFINLFKEVNFDELFTGANPFQQAGEMRLFLNQKQIRVNIKIHTIFQGEKLDSIIIICQQITDIIRLSRKYTENKYSVTFDQIITADSNMLQLIENCKRIAAFNCSVLLEGDSGTGKEMFAQAIHNQSARHHRSFVAVNCAALPINLMESELFGYEKGAFSGALPTGKAGKFELAHKGTLFLDEIGELPLDMQAKLLRVLDNSKVSRIGGSEEIPVDVRVVAATNRDLLEEIKMKNFREDLYYRLNVISFKIPPLSMRKGDIPLLVDFFLIKLNNKSDQEHKKMAQECMELLCAHQWKGNVRELQNAVTRAYYLCPSPLITSEFLSQNVADFTSSASGKEPGPPPPIPPVSNTRAAMEREWILKAIIAANGNITQAYKALNISKSTMYRKIQNYGISPEEYLFQR